MISDSSLTTDTKLRYLGLLFNKAVLVIKAYRNLAPPYLKQLSICSSTQATSRFITLPEPRIDRFKTSFSFSDASLWNAIPTQIKSCNSLTSFKTQLHRWFRSILLYKTKYFLVYNVCIVCQCYYELIYYSFILIIIVHSH